MYKFPALLNSLKQEQSKELNTLQTGQEKAYELAQNNDLTVIWGSPGTGKTHTLANIAIDMYKSEHSVLIVSQSNISVDGAILKISELAKKKDINIDGKAFRYGFITNKDILSTPIDSFFYVLQRDSDIYRTYYDCTQKLNSHLPWSEYKKYKQIRNGIIKDARLAEDGLIQNSAGIVATTITKALTNKSVSERKWDVVIIDEVSMANIPQVISISSLAKSKLILVGDFRQLAPVSTTNSKQLKEDIFSFLGIVKKDGTVVKHPLLVMLNVQRRMHSKIAEYVNNTLYEKAMVFLPEIQREKEKIANAAPFSGEPIVFLDYSEYRNFCDATRTGSRFNLISGLLTIQLAKKISEAGQSVEIITPYSAQADLIDAFLYQEELSKNIKASTVHQFQGNESDVIIFDTVESFPKRSTGKLFSSEDDDQMEPVRLLNVAMTRARGKFIILGNYRFLKDCDNNAVIGFLNYWNVQKTIVRSEIYRMVKDLNVSTKTFKFYSSEKQAEIDFTKDFNTMKHGYMYFHSSNNVCNKHTAKLAEIAENNNKQRVIYASQTGTIDLPKVIYKEALTTYHPRDDFYVIDNKIIWYGIPLCGIKVGKLPLSNGICYVQVRVKTSDILSLLMKYIELDLPKYEDQEKEAPTKQTVNKGDIAISLPEPREEDHKPQDISSFVVGSNVYYSKYGKGVIKKIDPKQNMIRVVFSSGEYPFKYPEVISNGNLRLKD